MEPTYADLKASVVRSLSESAGHASTAENMLSFSVDSDPTIDELSKVERAAVAAVYAQLAQAAALTASIRSQALLLEEVRELNTLVRAIAMNMPVTPSTGPTSAIPALG